jgi:hypothetical protein
MRTSNSTAFLDKYHMSISKNRINSYYNIRVSIKVLYLMLINMHVLFLCLHLVPSLSLKVPAHLSVDYTVFLLCFFRCNNDVGRGFLRGS